MNDTNETLTTPEEKGAKFLQWIAENQREMKKALRKNCTFDPEIFDDVFSESIINVHSTIVKNNREIDNIKNYFFLAVKWQYQMRQNQHRKMRDNAVREYFATHDSIDEIEDQQRKDDDYTQAIQMMKEVLSEEFGERWTEIFLTYWAGRINNKTSYQMIATAYGLDEKLDKIKTQLQRMRSYVCEELRYVTDLFTTDYAYDS